VVGLYFSAVQFGLGFVQRGQDFLVEGTEHVAFGFQLSGVVNPPLERHFVSHGSPTKP
jgi:hypothetical protein